MKTILFLSVFLFLHSFVLGAFVEIPTNFTDYACSSADWGDYDNDGYQDVILATESSEGAFIVISNKLYHNNADGTFSFVSNCGSIEDGKVAWGDYNNDGFLDIIAAVTQTSGPQICIFRNNGNGTFSIITRITITGLFDIHALAWGDYDNDGYQDFLAIGDIGQISNTSMAQVYHNNRNDTFTDINAGLTGANASASWVDYDNDGDLDIWLMGFTNNTSVYITKLYRNDGNSTFTDIDVDIPATGGECDWGDYDNDGDFDILLVGLNNYSWLNTKVYRNNGDNTFTDIYTYMPGFEMGTANWIDFDNDGDLDALITGYLGNNQLASRIYKNNGIGLLFNNALVGLTSCLEGSASCADIDNDGDSDILISGYDNVDHSVFDTDGRLTKLYRNDPINANSRPSPPDNLTQIQYSDYTVFSWDEANDDHTPGAGLTYMVRIGTTPGGSQITGSLSDSTGLRKVAAFGTIGGNCSWKIKNSALPSHYYWSVQSIDSSMIGSSFAPELEVGTSQNEDTNLTPGSSITFLNVYPNPFSSQVKIGFELSKPDKVEMKLYNFKGQLIQTISPGIYKAGKSDVMWDGKDNRGEDCSNSIYVLKLVTSKKSSVKKVIKLK